MSSKLADTVNLKSLNSIENQEASPYYGGDVCGILEIPQPVLNNIFQYLTIDDLVNISVTCSTLNDYVDDFLRIQCTPKRLEILDGLQPIWNSLSSDQILEVSAHFFSSLETTMKLYHRIFEGDTTLTKREQYYLLDQKRLVSFLDLELTGKWVGIEQTDIYDDDDFIMMLEFDQINCAISGHYFDSGWGDYAVITGSYYGNMSGSYHGRMINLQIDEGLSEPFKYEGTMQYNSITSEWKVDGVCLKEGRETTFHMYREKCK